MFVFDVDVVLEQRNTVLAAGNKELAVQQYSTGRGSINWAVF